MSHRITRRAMLGAIPAAFAAAQHPARKAKPLPNAGEFVRFLDPTTETPVVRLTSLSSNSLIPAPTNRFVSVSDRSLLFSSDRTGKAAPFQLDLRTGLPQFLTPTSNLDPRSLFLDEKQKLVYLIDAGAFKEIGISNKRVRVLADNVTAFSKVGSTDFAVVRFGRLELLNARRTLAESVGSWCLMRPGGQGCAFGRNSSAEQEDYWYVSLSGSPEPKPVLLAKGRISNPIWSPDGQSLLFLRDVEGPAVFFSEIHEVVPETLDERCVEKTSQFAAFSPNGDGSVFVGASRSKAQPTVILQLRSPKRELTLCEHRASHPASVSPAFSPDSRRVYFQSDREGKFALYSVNVELLVEPTASSTAQSAD